LKKIRQIMKVRAFSNKTKTQLCMASMAHWLNVSFLSGGARVHCSSPGKYNIFKLGLPPSHENAGGLSLAGHLEK
jgi:hypothetical protein